MSKNSYDKTHHYFQGFNNTSEEHKMKKFVKHLEMMRHKHLVLRKCLNSYKKRFLRMRHVKWARLYFHKGLGW